MVTKAKLSLKSTPAQEARLKAIMAEFVRLNPHPKPALNFTNAFELLTAVVLSAQTTDAQVNKVTPALFKAAPTPQLMAQLTEDEIRSYIDVLGLGAIKAKRLKTMAEQLVTKFKGQVPSKEQDLVSLPGVGVKTARVILNIIFKVPCVAVDTHVFRVTQRLELCAGRTPEAVSDLLPQIIPPEYLLDAHHHLLLHGRHVCTARKPHCKECPVASWCNSKDKNLA